MKQKKIKTKKNLFRLQIALLAFQSMVTLPSFKLNASYKSDMAIEQSKEDFNKDTEKLEFIPEELVSSNNLNEEEKSLIRNENLIESIDELNIDRNYYEYIHLLQANCDYRILTDGSAEIICEEFYNYQEHAYPLEMFYTKILMEIIGSEPIWRYNFEENSRALEEAIEPYLTAEEYKTLMQIFNMETEDFQNDLETLIDLLNHLYYNKYGISMYEDSHIKPLLNNSGIFQSFKDDLYYNRIYFNEEKMNHVYLETRNRISLDVIDDNYPLYKLRSIDSIDELKEGECVHIDESGQYYAKMFVSTEEYFSDNKDSEYRYVILEEFLGEIGMIPKCGDLEKYRLDIDNGYIIYTVGYKRSNIFEKFPEQSLSKGFEYTLIIEK